MHRAKNDILMSLAAHLPEPTSEFTQCLKPPYEHSVHAFD